VALALAIWLAPAPARAQSSIVSQIAGDKAATDKLYFSLRFGISANLLKGMEGVDRLGGANVGLFATIRLPHGFALAPEFVPFSRKGVTDIPFVPTGDPGIDPHFTEPAGSALILACMDAAVLLKYRLNERLHFGAGPFVGFLTSATERFRAELETGEELIHKKDVTGEYRDLDYGLVLEASWVMTKPRRGEGLVFHFRYQAGLADVLRDPAAPLPVRSSVIQVFLSFPFIR